MGQKQFGVPKAFMCLMHFVGLQICKLEQRDPGSPYCIATKKNLIAIKKDLMSLLGKLLIKCYL